MDRQDAVRATEAAIKAKNPEVTPPTETVTEPETPTPEAAKPEVAIDPKAETPPAAVASDEDDDGNEDPEDAADSDGGDATEPQKPKRRGRKRIQELTRLRYEEKARADALEARLREMEQRLPAQMQPSQAPANAKGRPTLEQFGYDQDRYEEARDAWVISQARESWTQQQQQTHAQQQQKERLSKFEARIAKFEAEQPGAWEQVLRSPVAPTPLMREVVADSDIGPRIAHYLALHLDEAFEITQLPERGQAVAMGRLEAKLSLPAPSAPQRPATNTTRAPAPAPVLPGGSPSGAVPASRMGIEDHIAAVRAKRQARLSS